MNIMLGIIHGLIIALLCALLVALGHLIVLLDWMA